MLRDLIAAAGPITRTIWVLLLATTGFALLLGRFPLAFISSATLLLTFAPPLLAQRLALRLPVPVVLATTLFIVASLFLGEMFDFYERLWWWDLALHGSAAVGFGFFGFLFIFMLFEGDRFAAPPAAIAFLSFCVAMTVGALWEVFEFSMDQLFGLNMQKSGLPDTMGDLIINAVGAVISSAVGYAYLRYEDTGPFGRGLEHFIALNKKYYAKARERLKR